MDTNVLSHQFHISSLDLLRVISEQEGVAIEELNTGKICDWFLKNKLKREQNPESVVLQWDDPFSRTVISISNVAANANGGIKAKYRIPPQPCHGLTSNKRTTFQEKKS
ncbi:hypothetical protein FCM35_KLT07975 [Carex littledalei]|uniref:Uncharacterized protein n=1 Tax=Carex littledalei TaxID=544730 RepID=A0A833QIV3_9POAL|nr:hypothetical protein FCM35_KLT07975 [Carex littledalei]